MFNRILSLIYYFFIFLLAVLLLPLLFTISVSILLFSGTPIIFSQKRTGLNGKTFTMYKFRTMKLNAGKLKNKYLQLNQADGPVFKIFADPRFTGIGRFLSHTGLDELPQLINIIKGEMALIGPRPLPVGEAKKLLSWQNNRSLIKPGIISPWIVNGYHSNKFSDWMKSDITYIKEKNIIRDIKLLIKTTKLFLRFLMREFNNS